MKAKAFVPSSLFKELVLSVKKRSQHGSFGGTMGFYSHESQSTKTEMRFAVYTPPQAAHRSLPVLYWLSGLTCTDENFMMKSGVQREAARLGLIVVAPDTSPRGAGIEGEDKESDFGVGASYYVNATQMPWAKNYKMEDYLIKDLIPTVEKEFPILPNCRSISGHSMGGHGAIVMALRHPGLFRSVSAFSPICAPSLSPWGQKAFTRFLGENKAVWEEYDAHCLVKKVKHQIPLLVDQGDKDDFLETRLMPDKLKESCKSVGYPLEFRMQAGYDHSYYFVASFLPDHLAYHYSALTK
jgi:S-formylglutathione hydrolase